jgi:hypothetical protein
MFATSSVAALEAVEGAMDHRCDQEESVSASEQARLVLSPSD